MEFTNELQPIVRHKTMLSYIQEIGKLTVLENQTLFCHKYKNREIKCITKPDFILS